jgi:nitrogen regulatory protein PII
MDCFKESGVQEQSFLDSKRVKKKLISIITEARLANKLVAELHALGQKGYTLFEAQGEGRHGSRGAMTDSDQNIVLQIICKEEDLERIAGHFYKKYNTNYAMMMTLTDIEILK